MGNERQNVRYRIVLVEEKEPLPLAIYKKIRRFHIPYVGPKFVFDPIAPLIRVLRRIRQKGPPPSSWAMPLSNDALAFVLASIDNPVLIRDKDGNILFMNPEAEKHIERLGNLPKPNLEEPQNKKIKLQGEEKEIELRSMPFKSQDIEETLVVEVIRTK